MGITVDIGTAEGPGPWRELLYVVIVVFLAVLAFGLMYGWKLAIDRQTEACITELKEVDRKLGEFKVIAARYETLQKELNFIVAQAQKLRELKYEPLKISYILREIPEILPEGTWISNLTINADRHNITFSTYAASDKKKALQLVAKMLDRISANPFFSNPKIGNISLREQDGVPIASFRVSLDYKMTISMLEQQEEQTGEQNSSTESIGETSPNSATENSSDE